MLISEFWMGVIVTLAVESLIIVGAAIVTIRKKPRGKHYVKL